MTNKYYRNISIRNYSWIPILLYTVFSYIWVYRYDEIVKELVKDTNIVIQIQSLRVGSFVVLTGLILYIILKYNTKKVNALAYTDDLTKLDNRQSFQKNIKKMVNRKNKFTVYLVDVNQFKHLNEIHGHDYGDLFLRALSKEYKSLKACHVYRWYGDHFLIVEKKDNNIDVMKTIRRIQKLSERTFELKDVTFTPTVSIGVTSYPADAKSFKEINQNLDLALEKAKEHESFQLYDKSLLYDVIYYNDIQQKLKTALENDEMTLYCQPIYDLKSNKTVSYEVLLRWFDENNRFNNIEKVIQIAEKTRQIENIDKWVINKLFKLIHENSSLHNKEFSINISSEFFNSEHIQDFLLEKTREYGIDSSNITLEITEHSVITNLNGTQKIMSKLKDKGFKMSLDDFGTKYSSLNYISKLPFDILKIDKSYIDNVLSEDADLAIIELIIQLANKLNYEIVCEGIEHKEQNDKLLTLGSKKGQGYYYSRPVPFDEII